MLKKVIYMLFVMMMMTVQSYAATVTIPYWGTDSGTILWADSADRDDYWTSIIVKGSGTGNIQFYDANGNYLTSVFAYPSDNQEQSFSFSDPNYKGIKLVATSGKFWAVTGTTTNPNNTTVNFEQPSNPDPPPEEPPPEEPPPEEPPPDTGGTTPTAMTLSATDLCDGSSDLTWSPVSGAVSYELYIDGVKSTYTSQVTTVTKDGSGSAFVKAIDSAGNVIGQSSTISFTSSANCGGTTDPPPDTGGTDCTECEKLAEMLACPEWDTYMGELTDAFADALPPPPDWDEVAEIMADHIVPPLIDGMVNEVVPAMGAEMDRILGHPDPPPSIPTPTVPAMDGTSGVNRPNPVDSTPAAETYDLNAIPSVQVEPDNTGGMDLTGADPIDAIPHNDADYMPMPGKETGGMTPTIQRPASTPTPTNQGTVEPPAEATPTPSTTTGPPPSPSAPGPDASVTPPPAPDMPMPAQE